jgi:hypothetical protein
MVAIVSTAKETTIATPGVFMSPPVWSNSRVWGLNEGAERD